MIPNCLRGVHREPDGIYSFTQGNAEQAEEIKFRNSEERFEKTAIMQYVGRHHSLPVMNHEVRKFLGKVTEGGVILDIGGGKGWHWREAQKARPDIKIIIMDMVRESLESAKIFFSEELDKTVFLLHADALSIPLPPNSLDAIWSVQALQHVPDFDGAVMEASRVLRPGGLFVNYSLNQDYLKIFLRAFSNNKSESGQRFPGKYWLARGSSKQEQAIARAFKGKVSVYFSEILFSPRLKLNSNGRLGKSMGFIDRYLVSDQRLFKFFARQISYHCRKNVN